MSHTPLSAGDLKQIGTLRQLEELELMYNYNRAVDDDSLNYNPAVDDDSLRELEGLRSLQSLKVWGTSVTAVGKGRIRSGNSGPSVCPRRSLQSSIAVEADADRTVRAGWCLRITSNTPAMARP